MAPLPQRHVPPDREPELTHYTHYEDTGCVLFPSCLRCPLPRCVYEDPRGVQHYLRQNRDREVLRLVGEGSTVPEIAARLGVSRRHVFRILRRLRDGSR
ncbi:MAG: hypothetical protein C4290_11960 [Chloroflexota bacterium]